MMKFGQLTSSETQLLLLDQYEQTFGLRTEEEANHPFSPILMNEQEDVYTDGAMHERFRQYDKHGIKDVFGLSFTEFIAHPTFRVVEMLNYANEAKTDKAAKNKKAIQDLGLADPADQP